MNRYFNDIDDAINWCSPESMAKSGVVIEKVIELNRSDYGFFIRNIQQNADFINENNDVQFVDSQMNIHCLFMKQEASEHGILICRDTANGDFYSGFVPNMDNFHEISVETDSDMEEQTGLKML